MRFHSGLYEGLKEGTLEKERKEGKLEKRKKGRKIWKEGRRIGRKEGTLKE
jgi:hypothetical protein